MSPRKFTEEPTKEITLINIQIMMIVQVMKKARLKARKVTKNSDRPRAKKIQLLNRTSIELRELSTA